MVGAVQETVALPVLGGVEPEPDPEEPVDVEVVVEVPEELPVDAEETVLEDCELASAALVDDEGEPPPQPDSASAAARPQATLNSLILTPPGRPGA